MISPQLKLAADYARKAHVQARERLAELGIEEPPLMLKVAAMATTEDAYSYIGLTSRDTDRLMCRVREIEASR